MDISALGKNKITPGLPKLSPGDNVRVSFKIKEANRERVQTFPGLVIKIARHNSGGNFTVRRVTSGAYLPACLSSPGENRGCQAW